MGVKAGTAYIEIVPELVAGFGRDLQRAVEPAAEQAGTKASSAIGGALKKAAVAAGGAFAATRVAEFFQGAVASASDLNETVSKSRTIFGPAAAAMEKWATGAASALGQSKRGALDAAATFGNLFVQLGTGTGDAAKLSRQMVELASDFASFHNADPTAVIESMTAAFRGEYDAVQRFVPTINAARVEQEALAMTGKRVAAELTAQEKALATQKLLMEGAGAAAGDFARTSDSLANRQRTVAAQMENVKTSIGNALLPVMAALTSAVSILMTWWTNLSPAGKELVGVIVAMAAAVAGVIAAVKTWTIVQGILNATLLANPVALVIAAVAALAAGLVVAYRNSETFRNIVDGAFRVVRASIEAVVRVGGQVVAFFTQNWGLILAPLTGGLSLLFQHFDKVRDVIAAVVDWLKKLPGFIDKALGPLDELLGKVGSIAGKVGGAVGGVLGKIKLPSFDVGGVVPGRIGEPRLLVAHGGETILPTHRLDLTRELRDRMLAMTTPYRNRGSIAL